MLSMISVIKTNLEAKRSEYIGMKTNDQTAKIIFKPLIKRKELQFKHLFKDLNKKMTRQTFVTNLQKAVEEGLVIKRDAGRSTYYSLNTSFPEEQTIADWLSFVKKRLTFVPDSFLLL